MGSTSPVSPPEREAEGAGEAEEAGEGEEGEEGGDKIMVTPTSGSSTRGTGGEVMTSSARRRGGPGGPRGVDQEVHGGERGGKREQGGERRGGSD